MDVRGVGRGVRPGVTPLVLIADLDRDYGITVESAEPHPGGFESECWVVNGIWFVEGLEGRPRAQGASGRHPGRAVHRLRARGDHPWIRDRSGVDTWGFDRLERLDHLLELCRPDCHGRRGKGP